MGKFKPNQQQQKQKKYNPLSGIKIAHDIEDFEEGQEIILTLEDQNILVGPTSDINEDNDKLENLQLKEKFKAQFNQDQKKLLAKGKNDYSEDKYEMERTLLPQYDEQKAEKKGFMLDEYGEYNSEKLRKLEEIKKKLQAKSDSYQSLNTDVKVASEYEENSNKFKKPKRKIPKSSDNPNNQKRKINSLIDFLEENAEDSMADLSKDHGNREKQKINEKQEKVQDMIEKKQKKEKYDAALEQARQDTQIAVEKYKKVQIFNEDDELDQLQQSIMKSQKIMQERQKKIDNDEVIQSLIEENKEAEIKNEQQSKLQDYEKIQAENKQQSQYEQSNDGKQQISTITTLTEFVKTIKTDFELKENEKKIDQPTLMKLSDTKHGTASILNISLPSDRLINQTRNSSQFGYQSVHFNKMNNKRQRKKKQQKEKQYQQEQQQQNNDEDENIDLEQVVQDEEFVNQEMEFTTEESLGSGLSGVLKKLQERGMLNEDQIDYSGRYNDVAQHTELNKFQPQASDKIKLEYRDETGKLMTPKEAFRYICHIFHGKKPGKNKRDKKMQKEQTTQRQKFAVLTNESQHMKKLKQQQQKTNQPFLLLSQSKQN